MNNNAFTDKRLLDALDLIDDKYIAEITAKYEVLHAGGEYGMPKRAKRRFYLKLSAFAAAVVLFAVLISYLPAIIRGYDPIDPAGSLTNEEATSETLFETMPPVQTAVFNFDSLSKRVDFIGSYFAAPYYTKISDNTRDMLLSVLNTGEWQKGVLDSLPEFTFEVQIQTETFKIEYNTSGSFRYNGYCKMLTEEESTEVNSYLRAEDPILNFDDLSNTVTRDITEAYEITLDLEDCAQIALILNEQHWKTGFIDGTPEYIFSNNGDSSEDRIKYYPKSGIFSYAGYLAFASEKATLEINEILQVAE